MIRDRVGRGRPDSPAHLWSPPLCVQAYQRYSEAADTLKALESDDSGDPPVPHSAEDGPLFGPESKSRLYARYAISSCWALERAEVEVVYQEALDRLKECGNFAVVCRWLAELLVSFAEVCPALPCPSSLWVRTILASA